MNFGSVFSIALFGDCNYQGAMLLRYIFSELDAGVYFYMI